MINGVSSVAGNTGVSFRANASDKLTNEMVSYPGNYAEGDKVEISGKKKKKGGFGKALGKLLLGAAIVVGGLIGLKRGGKLKKIHATELTSMQKINNYLEKAAQFCDEKVTKAYKFVVNGFKKDITVFE